MLTCEDVNEFIIEYLDDELDEVTRRRFEDHVADCRCCHAFFEQYKATVELVKDGEKEMPEVPDELADRTLSFLNENISSENGEPS